ncbi:MAG: hypothetical protein HGA49_12620 [Eubacteriaceae bacterium]|nr:hypothetical protein [Eubacteriaceae bacterium]
MGGKAFTGFMLLFESFAIELLLHCANIKAAVRMLHLNSHALDQFMRRAAERGVIRRKQSASSIWASMKRASRQATIM